MRKILNISMPPSLYDYVERRTAGSKFGSVSEYVRDLIREDERRFEEKYFEKMEREIRLNREIFGSGPHSG